MKKIKSESLEAVHTHTHTLCLLNKEKVKKYIGANRSIVSILDKKIAKFELLFFLKI